MKEQHVRLSLVALIFLILLLCVYSAAWLQAAPPAIPADQPANRPPSGPTRLLRYADISKDKVVFSYAGDLWTASREGGAAVRVTASAGDKLYPKFSPDGKWIAFTASYDGNPDVYIIPSEGGEPRRLTFHPSADIVLGWSPDGKNVLFRSDRAVAFGHGIHDESRVRGRGGNRREYHGAASGRRPPAARADPGLRDVAARHKSARDRRRVAASI